MIIMHPQEFGIYQRMHDNCARVPVVIESDENIKQIKYSCAKNGKTPAKWKYLDYKQKNNMFTGEIILPAGAWYKLDLELILADKSKITVNVKNFGIGEVFITAGQSNSANWGETKQKTKTGMVTAFNGKTWQIANDPMPVCGGEDGSIWPLVGDALNENLNVPVGFLCLGVGGSGITDWDPEIKDLYPEIMISGEMSPDSIKALYMRYMIVYVPLLMPYGCRALLWHQGETDTKMDQETYYRALKKLILNFRRDFTDIPWLIAIIGNKWESPDYGHGPRNAQQQIINENLALQGPDTDILGSDFRGEKTAHFNDKGIKAHANLWIRSIENSLFQSAKQTGHSFELDSRHVKAVERRRRIINQEDANEPGAALGMDIEKWIEHRFDLIDTPGCQIDTIFWDIGFSEDSYAIHLNSKLLPPLDHAGHNKWREQGIDWVKVLIDESHKRNLEAFWNHRICPVDMPQPFDGNPPHDDPSRDNYLKKANPDWINKCWWPQGLWNMANPELRKHKLKFLRELIELYDLDGFQLDFARHSPCLPLGREWENRDHVTEFIRQIRTMLLEVEKQKNKAILLAVRVGETIPGCHADGFEVEKWAKENLVDIFVLGGRTAEVDIESFKKITKGKNIKICPSFDGHHTNDGYYSPPVEYFRGVFSNWWAKGADSVSVFNWTCAHEEKYDELSLPSAMKSPSQRQALFEIGTSETMSDKEKMYAVERRGGYPWAGNYLYRNDDKPLPFTISRDQTKGEFPIFIQEEFVAVDYSAQLDVMLWKVSREDIVGIFLNGISLKITDVNNEYEDGEVYFDKPQPTCGFMAWSDLPVTPEYKLLKVSCPVNPDFLLQGKNCLKISFHSKIAEKKATVEKIELSLMQKKF